MLFGAHCSAAGGLHTALERAASIEASICQFFVKNNMQWFGKPFPAAHLAEYRSHLAQAKLAAVFGHTGYLINLAAPASENRQKSIQSLVQEIQLATEIDLPFLVLHPGAHLGAGEAAGIALVVKALNEVFQITKDSRVRIALENTAGQGSCLGFEIRHLAEIFDQVDRPQRLGICLDTAHFLAAGYDIRTPKGWDTAIEQVDSLIGAKEILAFHLNDSKTDLGSRVDRHAHIGQGKIGREAFRHIVNDERFRDHPGCLETPKSDDLHEDVENLAVLRSLIEPTVTSKVHRSSARGSRKATVKVRTFPNLGQSKSKHS
jgi:deoxyribonuclease IV